LKDRPEGRLDKAIARFSDNRSVRSDEGLTIFLKINYKVILLMVVALDIAHVSINEILGDAIHGIFY